MMKPQDYPTRWLSELGCLSTSHHVIAWGLLKMGVEFLRMFCLPSIRVVQLQWPERSLREHCSFLAAGSLSTVPQCLGSVEGMLITSAAPRGGIFH